MVGKQAHGHLLTHGRRRALTAAQRAGQELNSVHATSSNLKARGQRCDLGSVKPSRDPRAYWGGVWT